MSKWEQLLVMKKKLLQKLLVSLIKFSKIFFDLILLYINNFRNLLGIIENDVRCAIAAEDLQCGSPVDFYKSSPNIEFNCNKELETGCEVSCRNGFDPTADLVKCSLKNGQVTWAPKTIACKKPQNNSKF